MNLKFTAWPEMLSYPYLRNNGYLLYKDMIHPYPPVLTMALSIVYKLFGYKLIVLKIFTWLIILASDVLIFLIAKKITKKNIFALVALSLYVLTQPFLEGNQLWFDLAIVPSILFGMLLLLNKRYFLSGLSLGIAILTKQTTGLFLILWGSYILIKERKLRSVINLLIGPIVLFAILLVRLITEGAVSGFFNWTLIYPFTQWSKFPGYVQMALTYREIIIVTLLVTPVIFLIFKLKKNFIKDKSVLFTAFCLLLSFVLIYPRFSFFHFQLGIAFCAILYSISLSKFKFSYILHTTYCILLFVLICLPVLKTDWGKETRFWGKEEEKTAEIIKKNSKPNDLIYLLGPQSALYVLSGRLPPKLWTDNYIWYLEIPGVQEEIIKGWNSNKPVVVFTNSVQKGNWYDLGTYRPQKIVDWIRNEKIETSILK
ncbi:MAG: glycosyltransferase family 39 protein [Candidatus Woesebacteria bacterium]|nr:glycosyltransferase family 39 protein [Candidatus Woesebacteria bacterium]